MLDSEDNTYFMVEININITDSNNITLRKIDVKPYGFDKRYMDKQVIEYKLYHITDQFTESKIKLAMFYSIPLN